MKTHFQNIPQPERTRYRIEAFRRLNQVQHIALDFKPIPTGWAAEIGKDEVVIRDKVRFRYHVSPDQWITFVVEDSWAEKLMERLKS